MMPFPVFAVGFHCFAAMNLSEGDFLYGNRAWLGWQHDEERADTKNQASPEPTLSYGVLAAVRAAVFSINVTTTFTNL
jgi:hypothetical protein